VTEAGAGFVADWRTLPCVTPADMGAMRTLVERDVKRVVSEHLGVAAADLWSRVSLRDELAADSLDLVGMAMELECVFEVALPDRVLERVRCYGDLVESVMSLVAQNARCA